MPRTPAKPRTEDNKRRDAVNKARQAADRQDTLPVDAPAVAAARPVQHGLWCKWEDLTPAQKALVPPAYRGSKWNPTHYLRASMTSKMSEARRALRKAGAADADIDSWVMPLEFLMRVVNATPDVRQSLGFFVDKQGAVHCEELTLGLRIEAAKSAAPYLHRKMPIAVSVDGATVPQQLPLLTDEVLAQLTDDELAAFKTALAKAKQANAEAYAAYASGAAAQQAYTDEEEMSVETPTAKDGAVMQAPPDGAPTEGRNTPPVRYAKRTKKA